MVSGIARMVGPWMALVAATGGRFVHGDWGLSNILVAPDDPTEVLP
jgi:aminoglycoside phosphotransferase (APT) family kinase protein